MTRKKANKIGFKFTPWPADVTKSKAWEQLTNAARVAYVHIRERWCFNRQEPVAVSYKSMERIMERKTYSNALKQLEEIGFIKKTQTGGIFRKRNYFQMSEKWRWADSPKPDREGHTDGISIKGSHMHTIKSEENCPTGSQMDTVNISDGVQMHTDDGMQMTT